MDERLTQVRALVDERWRVARERRQQNELLARRIEALEQYLSTELLPKRAKQDATLVELESQILKETNASKARRRKLQVKQEELSMANSKALRSKRQIDFLREAVEAEKIHEQAIWSEMMEDLAVLRDEDKLKQAQERQKTQELVERLQSQLAQLDTSIAQRKKENDQTLRALEASKCRKRALELNLYEINATNQRLKKKHQDTTPRPAVKPFAETLEAGVDSVLRQLDEMRR